MKAELSSLAAIGLEEIFADATFFRAPNGACFDASGGRVVAATPEALRSLRHVLEREQPDAWNRICKATGISHGRNIVSQLDRQLAGLAKPALRDLPLDASLALIARIFRAHGWGVLTLDLVHAAEHGVVIAMLEHSLFAELMPNTNDFVDGLPAGVLQAYFQQISGYPVTCLEIACRSRGAPHCQFVIAATDRIVAISPSVGKEPADAIIARLRQ